MGEQELQALLAQHAQLDPSELVERIVSLARAHAGTAPQSGDLTVAAMRCT